MRAPPHPFSSPTPRACFQIAAIASVLCAGGAKADTSAALFPVVNEGVATATAVQIEHALRAAIAEKENELQAAALTEAIIEGARTSGLDCDINLAWCACEFGALANTPTVYVARILNHQERGYWVELRRLDVVKKEEVFVRRTAITLDEPAFSDGLGALVDSVIRGSELEPDLRGPESAFPLDLALYSTAGAIGGLSVIAAVGAGTLLVVTYNLAGRKVATVAEAEADVNAVRTLGAASSILGGAAAVGLAVAMATAAAGGAVSAHLFEE